jgi:cell wall-associated NlpC family hydrolase
MKKISNNEKRRILRMYNSIEFSLNEQDNQIPYNRTIMDSPDLNDGSEEHKNIVTTTTTENQENLDQNESNNVKPQIVELSKNYLGIPYVYGSQGPKSFDCSGFIRFLLTQVGVLSSVSDQTIPRTASGIYNSPKVTKLTINDIKPGDLVFFKDGGKISHIGLVSNVGKNEKGEKIFHMVHASSSSGIQDTEKTNYTKNGVNKSSYWGNKIAGYGRLS